MIDFAGEVGQNLIEKTVVIVDCNCPKWAKAVEQQLLKRYHFKESVVMPPKGLVSVMLIMAE